MDKYKKMLENRLVELENLMTESQNSSKPVQLDQQAVGRVSRGDALMQQAMAVAVKNRRKQEIQRVKSALEKFKNDDYGYCAACDEKIPPARLELDPSVALCIKCAK